HLKVSLEYADFIFLFSPARPMIWLLTHSFQYYPDRQRHADSGQRQYPGPRRGSGGRTAVQTAFASRQTRAGRGRGTEQGGNGQGTATRDRRPRRRRPRPVRRLGNQRPGDRFLISGSSRRQPSSAGGFARDDRTGGRKPVVARGRKIDAILRRLTPAKD